MINKVYGKTKQFIKNNYKFLIVYFITFFICLYPLPYYIYVGGGTINLEERFTIVDEYKEEGSFNLAYVRELRATVPTYLLSYVLNWERENIGNYKIDESESKSDIWQREKMYLQESIDNAIINAYRKAGEEIVINGEHYKVLSVDSDADTDLLVNDIILEINGIEIKEYNDIIECLKNSEVDDDLEILVNRNNKEVNCRGRVILLDETKKLGVYLLKEYDYDINRNIDINFTNREGGSSGGFMLSLAIYNRLIEKDLTSGLKIVGTGSIDDAGNVGSIGGVKHKLKGAVSDKADIFFVPDGENYQEALDAKKKNNYKIEIVAVKNLDMAISYLESRS